jgi:hypothetical protein
MRYRFFCRMGLSNAPAAPECEIDEMTYAARLAACETVDVALVIEGSRCSAMSRDDTGELRHYATADAPIPKPGAQIVRPSSLVMLGEYIRTGSKMTSVEAKRATSPGAGDIQANSADATFREGRRALGTAWQDMFEQAKVADGTLVRRFRDDGSSVNARPISWLLLRKVPHAEAVVVQPADVVPVDAAPEVAANVDAVQGHLEEAIATAPTASVPAVFAKSEPTSPTPPARIAPRVIADTAPRTRRVEAVVPALKSAVKPAPPPQLVRAFTPPAEVLRSDLAVPFLHLPENSTYCISFKGATMGHFQLIDLVLDTRSDLEYPEMLVAFHAWHNDTSGEKMEITLSVGRLHEFATAVWNNDGRHAGPRLWDPVIPFRRSSTDFALRPGEQEAYLVASIRLANPKPNLHRPLRLFLAVSKRHFKWGYEFSVAPRQPFHFHG